MYIFIPIIISIFILHIISWITLKCTKKSWTFFSNISKNEKNIKKSFKKGKAKKIYTIKKGGALNYFIIVVYSIILIASVYLILYSIKIENKSLQFLGLFLLFFDIVSIIIISNFFIQQKFINTDPISKKINFFNYLKLRIKFFINNTFPSFLLIICVVFLATDILVNILNMFFPELLLGTMIGFFILLSLYSNTFILENTYYSKEESPFKNNSDYELYISQKKIGIYTFIFTIATYAWYEDLLELENKLNANNFNFRGDLLLISTVLLFFLSTDRIFKLINDDYIKYKKEYSELSVEGN